MRTKIFTPIALVLLVSWVSGFALIPEASAQSQGVFTTEGERVTVVGAQTGAPTDNELSAFGLSTRCSSAVYTGHEIASTAWGVANGAENITVTPHYGSCTTAGFPTTINLNGCDFEFELEQTTVEEHKYFTHFVIECPENKHISITTYTSSRHTNHFCETVIVENITGKAGLRAINSTEGTIVVHGTVSGFEAHKESGSDASIFCPSASTGSISFSLDLAFEGASGEAIGISD